MEEDVAATDDSSETSKLEERIRHTFSDRSLLQVALVHTIEIQLPDLRSNGRLAFLGDAVVKLVVSHALYEQFRDADQGILTEKRKEFEGKAPQAEAARSLGLDRLLRNSKGKPIPRDQLQSSTAPATAFEALVGAVYLDGKTGPMEARDFVWRTLLTQSHDDPASPG